MDNKLKVKYLSPDDLVPFGGNPRTLSSEGLAKIEASLSAFGFTNPILAQRSTRMVIAGHQRLKAAKAQKLESVPVIFLDMDDATAKAYNLADNRTAEEAEWVVASLQEILEELDAEGFDLGLTGFDDSELQEFRWSAEGGPTEEEKSTRTLAERFGVPPFTVLDARQGYWQDRKREWLKMGIESHKGRAPSGLSGGMMEQITGRLAPGGEGNDGGNVTSIFDPVLCEIIYRWFAPPDGVVFDPFAGGSVRGVVAATLGRQYLGIDLRPEQVTENRRQGEELGLEPMPVWVEGDSKKTLALVGDDFQADLIFSCPPYVDLEVYSDDPRDLSTMPYEDFLATYREIIKASADLLKPERFACFVVGEVRDRRGFYYGFVPDTIRAFEDAGLRLYNEAVLVTAGGTLPKRAVRPFVTARKLGKGHQNVLIFYKGDPSKIRQELGEVEDLSEEADYGEKE